ncbi:GNAT family N-acetyltransferase [Roseibacterium sp. SDUM158016]|uniref:GNAT family N-acetyltransferase n=1 Tax=Roseicyclus sediminis TaxID=2980997 RepID=UPI0021D30A77|nr:GNAT family N-acetyltransferase [Roseibacterium sp. SDUM158016]MCU4653868.1 GNAT family N-acetyltransferase [Roseibacterium sp. SDUM158016]
MSDLSPIASTLPRAVADLMQGLGPLQQSAPWVRALRLLGTDMRPLAPLGLNGHAMVRTLPLLGRTAMISRGPACLSIEQAAGLRRALGVRHLVVHAETEADALTLGAVAFRKIVAARHIAELRIDLPPDALLSAMSCKWRNRLRHALGQGLSVTRRPMPADPRHWLFVAEAGAARRLRYAPLPPALIAAICAADPGAGQLFTVSRGREQLAAMLFLRHGNAATYQIGWSTAGGRARSAGNLCLWRAMLELGALGVRRIDLGAAETVLAPGLARFKTGAGGVIRPLGGSWLDTGWLPGRRTGAVIPQVPLPDVTLALRQTMAVAVSPEPAPARHSTP